MFSLHRKKKKGTGDLYRRIDKKPLRYVTERDSATYVESVIGRDCRLNIYDDAITIWGDGKELFRGLLEGADIGELMSLDGVLISADDASTGKRRHIVAYYKYYRNV